MKLLKNIVLITTALFVNAAYAETKIDKVIDAELNLVYQKALKNHSDDRYFSEALKQAQRDWLTYRVSQCEILTGTYHISTSKMVDKYTTCINNMNEQRIKFINIIDTIVYED